MFLAVKNIFGQMNPSLNFFKYADLFKNTTDPHYFADDYWP